MKHYQRLKKENEHLKEALQESSTQLAIRTREKESLQEQLDIAQLGVPEWTESEKKNLNTRIDGYLKEIDKCLALLNA